MLARFFFLFLLVGLPGLALRGRAQTFDPRSAVPPDSVNTDADELALRPDSLRRRFDEERVLMRLKAYSHRRTLAGKALGALFNFSQRQEEQAGLDAVLLDRQFDRHNFKVVRRVNIRSFDAFGYSLTDSLRQPRTFWEKSGNALHLKTSRSRIRQVLLFRPGQELLPQALAESERLLRQSPEILDARVLVNEATTGRDSVDIEVLTTDVFSLTGGFELGTATSGRVTAGDVNFLGQGHQIDNSYTYGRGLPQTWAYEGNYTAPFRHFFYAQARYQNEYNRERGGVALRRDFYSPTTRYAGALALDFVDQNITISTPPPGEPYQFLPLRYAVQDLWVGRALRLRSYDLGYDNPGRFVVAARFLRTQFTARPTPEYASTAGFLGTLGYSVRRYYKDRYLFGFGRTEDVPVGTLLSITAGYDQSRITGRRYVGARFGAAAFSLRHGYFYGGAELGSFQRLNGPRVWEQGLLGTETVYFTRLYHFGNWQYRHFLSTRATVGLRRRPGEVLYGVEDGRGLRGFTPAQPIQPTSRFVINYESNFYTPLSLLGFRLAAIVFADAAWAGTRPGGGTPFTDSPYTAVGLGVRFRNEFTALRTFQLLFGYYPRGLNTPNGTRLFETSRETVTFNDFGLAAPGVGNYQ